MCYNCGEAGHIKRDSKNGGQLASARGTWHSSWGRQGAGRGSYIRGRGQRRASAHRADQQGQKNGDKNSAWVTTVAHHTAHNNKVEKIDDNEINWLLDSGCMDHIINDDRYFDKFIVLKRPVNVHLGNNEIVKATKIGNVLSYFNAFGKVNLIDMENVFYVKDMRSNLISYSKVTENNMIISKGKISKIIDYNGKVTAVALKDNGLYIMKSKLNSVESHVNIANKNTNDMSKKEK